MDFVVRNSKYLENTKFRKLEPIPSSDEGKETPTLLGILERANLNHSTIYEVEVNLRPTISRLVGLGVGPLLGQMTKF
jgi:hypothetical protein